MINNQNMANHVAAVAQEVEHLSIPSPCSLHAEVSLGQTTEPPVAPGGVAIGVWMCVNEYADEQAAPCTVASATSVWMCVWKGWMLTRVVKRFEWSYRLERRYINQSIYHLPFKQQTKHNIPQKPIPHKHKVQCLTSLCHSHLHITKFQQSLYEQNNNNNNNKNVSGKTRSLVVSRPKSK